MHWVCSLKDCFNESFCYSNHFFSYLEIYMFIWILILISLVLVLLKSPRSPFPWDAWRFHWGCLPHWEMRPSTPLLTPAGHSHLFAVDHCSLILCSAIPSSPVSPGLWSDPTTQRGLPTHSCLPTLRYCPSFTYPLSSVDHPECNPLEGPVVVRLAQS